MITAEEFCNDYLGFEEYGTDVPYFMIEFAKLHVERALKQASTKLNYNKNFSTVQKEILNIMQFLVA